MRTLIAASVLAAGLAWTQSPSPPAAPPLHFDAATVSVSKPGAQQDGGGFLGPGHQVVFLNATMLQMITTAYGFPNNASNKILGGPNWLATNLYDLRAETSAAATPEQMQQMLQALLADRFALVAHTEQRPMPAYALTVAGGISKLKPAAASDEPGNCQRKQPASGAAPTPGRSAIVVDCTSMSMSELADDLPNMAPAYIDRPVLDHTGLAGKYDFELSWIGRGQLRASSDSDYDPSVDISMSSAVEKLGLKLDSTTAPANVVVVDSVSPTPTESLHPLPPMPPMPTAFDVAAIKPQGNLTQKDFMIRVTPGGEVDICCFPLQVFITEAFDIDARRIVNPPKWLDSTSPDDHWSVRAKTVPGANIVDVLTMLQNLLQTRFGLVYHEETQRVPVFALHADHPKLTPNTQGGRSDCAMSMSDGNINYACTNMTMAQFTAKIYDFANGYLTKPVVDKTGLPGAYDFTLTWAPVSRTGYNGAGARSGTAPATAPTPGSGMTLFEAVDKQLGLKLVSDKQPVKVIVIDHLNRTPTPN